MIFDGVIFDSFQDRYGVRRVETERTPMAFFSGEPIGSACYHDDAEVRIEMSSSGFREMMRDLSRPSNADDRYFRTTFEIDKLDVQDDNKPWVAKYDIKRHSLETINVLANKLASDFPDKKIVFIPNDINIELLGIEGLTALRDHLNTVIESLDFDNIMGF